MERLREILSPCVKRVVVKPKKNVVSTGLIGLNEVTDRQVRGFSGSGTHAITHKSIFPSVAYV